MWARLSVDTIFSRFFGIVRIDESNVDRYVDLDPTTQAALVDDVPEIAELDLNPVFVRSRGVVAVDARIRVAPMDTGATPARD
jgi:acyl-CoA synthetase (NDP forming)